MADVASDEPVVASRDGITVEKRYEPDDFPVPAIAFTVRSGRDGTVSVRLVDTVPDDVEAEDVGFHPKYGAEFWAVEGERIVFHREFEPDEEYVTVYGLRGRDAADVERFLTEPTIDAVEPAEEGSGDVVRDVIDAGIDDGLESAVTEVEASEQPDLTDDDPDLDIDLPEPEPTLDDGAVDDDGLGTAPPAGEARGPAMAAGGAEESVVAALAAEIRNGEVDDDDLEELREALGVTDGASTDARIEHLQSQVADLEAYTEALEAFLDEEGDAQAVLEGVREDYAATTERLDEVDEQLSELSASVDDRVDEELESVRDDVAALGETGGELEAELADVAEMRDRLASALSGIGGGSEPADDDA